MRYKPASIDDQVVPVVLLLLLLLPSTEANHA
jgi:hypothetical protein